MSNKCPTCHKAVNVDPISQRDERWGHKTIGKTKFTLYDFGCTISSICMALHKLRGYGASPADAGKFWQFDSQGRILWTKTEFKGGAFVWRGYTPDIDKMKEYANSYDKAVIVNVDAFGKIGGHWLYVESINDGRIQVIDPLRGTRHDDIPPHYQLRGYALFKYKQDD